MRPFILAVAVGLTLINPAYAGEGGGEPPVVTIYDITHAAIDTMTVEPDEQFTLIGVATGDIPLYYFWYEGELIATGNMLADYSFSDPGDYVITLEVIDRNGLSGSDSVFVIVQGGGVPVPIQVTTWGRIKALYE
jgi:hypothetical protein